MDEPAVSLHHPAYWQETTQRSHRESGSQDCVISQTSSTRSALGAKGDCSSVTSELQRLYRRKTALEAFS